MMLLSYCKRNHNFLAIYEYFMNFILNPTLGKKSNLEFEFTYANSDTWNVSGAFENGRINLNIDYFLRRAVEQLDLAKNSVSGISELSFI